MSSNSSVINLADYLDTHDPEKLYNNTECESTKIISADSLKELLDNNYSISITLQNLNHDEEKHIDKIMKEDIIRSNNEYNKNDMENIYLSGEELTLLDNIREEEKMKRQYQKKLFLKQFRFLLISFSLIVVALVNLLLFASNKICFNPVISLAILIAGIGWSVTDVASFLEK